MDSKLSINRIRYPPGFFGYNDGNGVGMFGDAQGGAVTEPEPAGDFLVFGYRNDASCCLNAVVANDHGTIVQRTVLEKDAFDKAGVDGGINFFAGVDVAFERIVAANDDESAHLALG